MAEIASAYPTAGGLYYWASKLGSPAWGWFTGWFNLIGQIGDHRRRSATGSRPSRTSLLNLLVRTTRTTRSHIFYVFAIVLLAALLLNLLRRPDHVAAEHDLGLLAHRSAS